MAVTVIDAGVVIALLDASDAHHSQATEAVRALREERGTELILPVSAYAEILVHPARSGPSAVEIVRRFCARLLKIEPLMPDMAEVAARLRSEHTGLRLPDALVIATAEVLDAARLVTTDRRRAELLVQD